MTDNHLAKLKKDIAEKGVRFIDLRFTDSYGKCHHITRYANSLESNFFTAGIPFDGSSISGWSSIDKSDMVLLPDYSSAFLDPFTAQPTLAMFCNVYDIHENRLYNRDPRSTLLKACEYLKSTNIADNFSCGLEVEFFVFDSVRFSLSTDHSMIDIESFESPESSGKKYEYGNHGHRPGLKGGYMPVPPVDSLNDIRSEILDVMSNIDMKPTVHHHEVSSSQCEVGFLYDNALKTADNMQKCKYIIHNVVNSYGKTATFMPKTKFNDNGNGMHCHQSLWKEKSNIFSADNTKGGLPISELCLYYIGGIIKHGKVINAFSNPTTNSYRRLRPGYEAPTVLSYALFNRSAAIRIPYASYNNPESARIEARFPDPSANPYHCLSVLLMAGIDGIINKIHPGQAIDEDIYSFSDERLKKMPSIAHSLSDAVDSLEKSCDFLKVDGVFTDDQISSYINLKRQEIEECEMHPTPWEYKRYYSC